MSFFHNDNILIFGNEMDYVILLLFLLSRKIICVMCLGANRWERLMILRFKSTAKMQEYILITDVSLNTYSIFRAKKTLNIILSY